MAAVQTGLSHVRCAAVPEPPNATWSNCLRVGQEVIISGMTAHPAASGTPMDTYDQTVHVFGKVRALLEAAGGHLGNVVKLVVYVTDIADKDAVNRARQDCLGPAPYPCSTLVEVKGLVFPALKVEVDAWSRLDVDRHAPPAGGASS
jgi:enamine deaminase RidA (YjgF/YER057c/UK114 family)